MAALEDLVVDTREVDRDLLASTLAPFLRLDRESAGIVPQEPWNAVSTEMRIVLFLLARKAMAVLGFPIEQEAASAGEIERGADLPSGTVRSVIKRLLKQRTVHRAAEGRYLVPNHALLRIRGLLRDWLETPS